MFFLGIGSYLLYLAFSKTYMYIRLFLLWTSLISIAILAQRMLSIPFDGRYELGIVAAYMYYEQTTNYALAFIGFMMLIGVGIVYAKPFIQTASSSAQVTEKGNRFRFLAYQVLVPMIIGSIIALFVPFPENIVPNSIAFLCAFLILVVVFIRAMTIGPVKIPKQKSWERWPVIPSVLLVVTLIIYRVVLTIGLHVPNPNVFLYGN